MKVDYINPVLESIVDVLTMMANVQPRAGKPVIKASSKASGDVTGIMSMVGSNTRGSIAITFSKPAILEICFNMLGDTKKEIDDDVLNLVGELTNMVTGKAKALLEEKGYDIGMSLPTVVSGKEHTIDHQSSAQKVLLPFNIASGKFFVELCFE
jgi:chemotaxis protein CheX